MTTIIKNTTIVTGDAQEHHQPAADLARDLAIDSHAGLGNSLDTGTHGALRTATLFCRPGGSG